jgi:hypothetical protein
LKSPRKKIIESLDLSSQPELEAEGITRQKPQAMAQPPQRRIAFVKKRLFETGAEVIDFPMAAQT